MTAKSFSLALLTLIAWVQPGAAQEPRWVPFGPPAAPTSSHLVVDADNGGQVAYAFNETGLWRSRDAAGSWRSIQAALGRPVQALTFDPFHSGRIYVATREVDFTSVIYRSDDSGDHWTPLFRSPGQFAIYQEALLADPFARDTLFWSADERLFRSRDAGKTWDCVPVVTDCANNFRTQGFAAAPDRAGTFYVIGGGGAGIHVSHDDGRTWTTSVLTVPYLDTLVATREPRTLYAWTREPSYRGNLTACFARSDDEGETWKRILPNTKCGVPSIDPQDPRTVRVVVVYNRVPLLWVSRNGGDTWTTSSTVPALGDVQMLSDGSFVLATDQGFYRAAGEQGPWLAANRGFSASEISSVLPVGESVLAVPVLVENGLKPPPVPLLRTEDGGRSWASAPLANPLALAADPHDPFHLIASAVRYDEQGTRYWRILESRDGGQAWRGIVDPQASRPIATTLSFDPFEPRTLFAGTLAGLYRSDDSGLTWRTSNLGLPPPRCHPRYGCSPLLVHTILTDSTRAGRIFIRVNDSGFLSVDYGITWTPLRTHRGPLAGSAYALARDSTGALIVIGGGSGNGDSASVGVTYRSTNGGAAWTRLGRLPLPPYTGGAPNTITGLVATPGTLWAGSRFTGVVRSTDGGRTWKALNQGLPLLSVTSLAVDPNDPVRVYATVEGNGVYALEP